MENQKTSPPGQEQFDTVTEAKERGWCASDIRSILLSTQRPSQPYAGCSWRLKVWLPGSKRLVETRSESQARGSVAVGFRLSSAKAAEHTHGVGDLGPCRLPAQSWGPSGPSIPPPGSFINALPCHEFACFPYPSTLPGHSICSL